MMVALRRYQFHKDDVVLTNHTYGDDAPLADITGLLMLAAQPGDEIEFLAVMDDDSFREFQEIIFLLCYQLTLDYAGKPDADYFDFSLLRSRSRKELISKLSTEAAKVGAQRVFVPVAQASNRTIPKAITASATVPIDTPRKSQIFVSYSHIDLPVVENSLVPIFRSAGCHPWYSVDSIRGAERWERSILDGLQTSEWFVVVMSPDAIKSEWVRLEVHWASEHRQGRIIPIMVSVCDPWDLHMRIGSLQYIDYRSPSEAARSKLLAILETVA